MQFNQFPDLLSSPRPSTLDTNANPVSKLRAVNNLLKNDVNSL